MDAGSSAVCASTGDERRPALVLVALEAVVEVAVVIDVGLVHDHGLEAHGVAEPAVAEDVLHPAVKAGLGEANVLADALAGLFIAESGHEGAAAGDLCEVLARAVVDVDVVLVAARATQPAVHDASAAGTGGVLVGVGDVVVPADGGCVVVPSKSGSCSGSSSSECSNDSEECQECFIHFMFVKFVWFGLVYYYYFYLI